MKQAVIMSNWNLIELLVSTYVFFFRTGPSSTHAVIASIETIIYDRENFIRTYMGLHVDCPFVADKVNNPLGVVYVSQCPLSNHRTEIDLNILQLIQFVTVQLLASS